MKGQMANGKPQLWQTPSRLPYTHLISKHTGRGSGILFFSVGIFFKHNKSTPTLPSLLPTSFKTPPPSAMEACPKCDTFNDSSANTCSNQTCRAWKCSQCSVVNSREVVTCDVCGAKRQQSVLWDCPSCDYHNQLSDKLCIVCGGKCEEQRRSLQDGPHQHRGGAAPGAVGAVGAPRAAPLNAAVPAYPRDWRCVHCTYVNTAGANHCAMCDSSRP